MLYVQLLDTARRVLTLDNTFVREVKEIKKGTVVLYLPQGGYRPRGGVHRVPFYSLGVVTEVISERFIIVKECLLHRETMEYSAYVKVIS